jgi:hypothetical protein
MKKVTLCKLLIIVNGVQGMHILLSLQMLSIRCRTTRSSLMPMTSS